MGWKSCNKKQNSFKVALYVYDLKYLYTLVNTSIDIFSVSMREQ